MKGILKKEKEYTWFCKEVKSCYLKIQKAIEIGNKKDWEEDKIMKYIKEIVFSDPYVGLLFIDSECSSVEEAIEESYNYIIDAYNIYVKRVPTSPEFNIYSYLKYTKTADLYNVSNWDMRSSMNKFGTHKFNSGNIEKSTLVIISYLKKYYKHYYL